MFPTWRVAVAAIALAACVLVLALVAILTVSSDSASGDPHHQAGDYILFAKASFGSFAESNCNGSNDGQATISGSTDDFYGRIHSNADLSVSGSTNDFFNTTATNPEVTYGTFDEDCQVQPGSGNNYFGGGPSDIDTLAPGVDPLNGWPGNLGTFLNPDNLTFSNTTATSAVGITCDVGDLTVDTDYVINPATDEGKVICRDLGKVSLNISGVGTMANPFNITILSHGTIEISGQNVVIAPQSHGVLAWTDQNSSVNNTSIKLAGSNLDVSERAILFTPRSGQDISGSDGSNQCLNIIGQGIQKIPGSNSSFGPFLPGCPIPATTTPTPSPSPTPARTVADAEPDSVADAEPDSVADAEPDSVADAEPDSVTDAEPDSVTDAEPDSRHRRRARLRHRRRARLRHRRRARLRRRRRARHRRLARHPRRRHRLRRVRHLRRRLAQRLGRYSSR